MTAQQRYEDISKRSGMSVDIVRAVLKAETESAIESLKHGETVNFAGRCRIFPSIDARLKVSDTPEFDSYIKLKAAPSSCLSSALDGMHGFIRDDENEEVDESKLFKEVSIRQITELI